VKKTRKFDPARAFRVCADMERMAARFYAEAARQTETPGIRDVFLRLAGTGTAHEEIFEEILKSKGTDKKFMKPFNAREMTSYIRHLTEKDTLSELAARGRFTDKEAVRAGLEAAKVSILFYTELKNLSGLQAAAVFERILKEEKGNYVMLSELTGETA
jgi:rubrerythrin